MSEKEARSEKGTRKPEKAEKDTKPVRSEEDEKARVPEDEMTKEERRRAGLPPVGEEEKK